MASAPYISFFSFPDNTKMGKQIVYYLKLSQMRRVYNGGKLVRTLCTTDADMLVHRLNSAVRAKKRNKEALIAEIEKVKGDVERAETEDLRVALCALINTLNVLVSSIRT